MSSQMSSFGDSEIAETKGRAISSQTSSFGDSEIAANQ